MPIPQLSKKVRSPRSWSKKNRKKTIIHRGESVKKEVQKFKRHRELIIKLLIYSFVISIALGGIFAIGTFIWVSRDLPNPNKLSDRILAETTKIYDRTGKHLLYEIHGDAKRTLIKINNLPEYTIDAFIAIEDKNFYKHKGISLWAIIRTAITNVLKHQRAGGSTLTQQFVKNSILTPEKTYTRKIKEAILAYQLEKKYSKKEILQLYFNEIPFGSIAYGIESASQIYFAKSARDLTLAESAILAAMVQAPTYYSPYGNHVDKLLARQKYVLKLMKEQGYITEEEMNKALEQKLVFQRQLEDMEAPHFVFYVKEQLVKKYGERIVEQGGLNVITTLDYDKQKIAKEVIDKYGEKNYKDWKASNAALVSIDTKTGQILAMVGSRDYFNDEIDGQVNVALRPRQPGSSFKPIVYAAAFKKGYLPKTVVFDVNTTFTTETGKDYSPKNYDLKEHGPVSLRTALQGSLNIPAVKTLYLTGLDNVLDLADKLGYTTLKDRSRFGLSLVLGGGEVTLLDHVFAYAAMAREGERVEPVSILKITDNNGKVWEEWKKPKKEKLEDYQQAFRMLNNVLSDDEARAYIFGKNSLLTLPDRPVATKTGTTNDYRDAWTIGYTPSIATGVWVGNNDNSEMKRGASGYTVAAPIWHEYMKNILTGSLVETFQKPKDIQIDKPMLGGSIGEEKKVIIDKVSGRLATKYTPLHLREEKIYRTMHNILYFVNKDDPQGPIPEDPTKDPQYNNWEKGLIDWAKKNNIVLNEEPPTEYDNIHLPEQQPVLEIITPQNNQSVGQTFSIDLNWSTVFTFKKIDIFIDDILQKTINWLPPNNFTFNLTLDNSFQPGSHFLKVVLHDEADNVIIKNIKINLN